MTDSDGTAEEGTSIDAKDGASKAAAGSPPDMSAKRHGTPRGSRRHQPTPTLSRDHAGLASDADEFATHSVEYWNRARHEERKAYYAQIETFYKTILGEFFQQANASAGQYRTYSRRHLATRRRMIVLTGFLAALNVAIAYTVGQGTDGWTSWLVAGVAQLPLFAALYAAALTVYSSLESLYSFAGRAQAFREVRELFLDSAREYEMLWNVNVRPFGYMPLACVNASIAYRRIVRKDIEVRSQAKELIERGSEMEPPGRTG